MKQKNSVNITIIIFKDFTTKLTKQNRRHSDIGSLNPSNWPSPRLAEEVKIFRAALQQYLR